MNTTSATINASLEYIYSKTGAIQNKVTPITATHIVGISRAVEKESLIIAGSATHTIDLTTKGYVSTNFLAIICETLGVPFTVMFDTQTVPITITAPLGQQAVFFTSAKVNKIILSNPSAEPIAVTLAYGELAI